MLPISPVSHTHYFVFALPLVMVVSPAVVPSALFAAAMIFDPVPLVMRYGVEKALEPPLAHYTKEFLPVAGDALVDFTRSVHTRSKSQAT